MCGICGIINLNKEERVEKTLLEAMARELEHRGPDEEGYYLNGNAGFGHKRLSIIDLSTGKQPLFNEDKSCCVILNGEIYNFKELRQELESSGHVFMTSSDTEVIIHAYEEFGEKCLERFRGMFAIAVWDSGKNRLFLARDRLGKKPLYYYFNGRRLIFASEIKSILKSGFVAAEVNRQFLDEFLTLGYVSAPHTLFRNIKKLPPASFLILENSDISIRGYWALNEFLPGKTRIEECQEKLAAILKESVKYRLISDVPLGAFLSGGIDSSIIVGLMSKMSSRPIKTFSVGYKGQENLSELGYAKKVADFFSTEHREIIVEPVDFYSAIPRMVWHLDEPIADQACIPLWLLSKDSKQFATVLLSGEGSDELFAGYPVYSLMKAIERYRGIPNLLKNLIDPLIPAIFGERRGNKYLEWTRLPLEKRYLGDMADMSAWARSRLYTGEMSEMAAKSPVADRIIKYYHQVTDFDILSKMQYLDIKTWLADDLLLKADKMTMAASIELRCPFLDHRFVEFSRTIPSEYKLKGHTTKYILKKAFEKFLPKDIAHRKKRGFPVPLTSWFRGDLHAMLADVLLDSKCVGRGYFNPEFIRKIIGRQKEKKEDYSKLLWSLLVLEFWHKVFIDVKHTS